MTEVGIREFRDHIAEYLQRSAEGENIVVTRNGSPLVRLVSAEIPSPVAKAFAEGRLRGNPNAPTPPLPRRVSLDIAGPKLADIVSEGRR